MYVELLLVILLDVELNCTVLINTPALSTTVQLEIICVSASGYRSTQLEVVLLAVQSGTNSSLSAIVIKSAQDYSG